MEIISREFWNNTFKKSASRCFVWTALKRTWKTLTFYFMLISAKATKMPTKTRSRALSLGNFRFLFLQHVLTHAQMGKFAPCQSLSLQNQISTHVSLLYDAYIKLLVILRKRLELLQSCTYGVMDVHHNSDRDLFSRFWGISTLKRKLNGTLTRHITAKDRWMV